VFRLCSVLGVLAAAALLAPAARADFTYENFNSLNSTTGGQTLQLNGNAALAPPRLRLTPALSGQAGSAFITDAISLGNNASFSTYFQFQITNNGGIIDEDGQGADGIVFVVQTVSNTAGGSGGGIGYQGINNSLGVEFDSWNNGGFNGDISGNHVGIDTNGSVASLVSVHENVRFNNGEIWNAWVDYDGDNDVLEVRWSLGTSRPGAAMLSYSGLDLPAILTQNDAYVGFTSGTGAAWGNHDILYWEFVQDFSPIGVPEPTSIVLAGMGLVGFVSCRYRRSGKAQRIS
jgi:hypothetical protein